MTVMGAYEVACNGDFANWKVAGAEGRRDRWRNGSRGVCETGVHHPGARHARRRTAAGGTLRAAGDGARRGEAGGDELRLVRTDRRWIPAARDCTGLHRRRDPRGDRGTTDRARGGAAGSPGRIAVSTLICINAARRREAQRGSGK